ncbi:MAG: sensor histidine kinase [Wujia sp.]
MKLKKLSGFEVSLRGFITLMIILVSALVLIVYSKASGKMYQNKYKEELIDNVEMQCEILTHELIRNDFNIYGIKNLSTDIDTIATFFSGRVLVVDKNYRVIKDTFTECENSYIINEDVIKTMNGTKALVKENDGFIQYMKSIKQDDGNSGVIIIIASTAGIKNIDRQLSQSNVVIYALIILLCVITALIVSGASVRGIKFINKQMEIAGDGHFDNPIPEKGFKEFRTMTEKYNASIEKLKVIDSTRQEFVSNVSHELKTPITSMKVLADSLVQNEEADLDMYKEFMTDIVAEIDRETKIINDLLTLVKMDKQSAEMNIEEVDINALLEIILRRVAPIAQTRGIEINYESYREVIAQVDEVKMSLALTNIIENAVKYNVDNGWIKVTLNADHKNFHVKVADSGVGIPDDCKDQVFERFYRVDKARSRDTGGTGLGLAITKNVILMHKGTIKLYSESGEGTTFTIKVPLKYSEN